MNYIYKADNLSLYIEENIILKNISFSLFKNKFNIIIGPGGSGKTTILKLISSKLSNFKYFGSIDNHILSNYYFIPQNSKSLSDSIPSDFISLDIINKIWIENIEIINLLKDNLDKPFNYLPRYI